MRFVRGHDRREASAAGPRKREAAALAG